MMRKYKIIAFILLVLIVFNIAILIDYNNYMENVLLKDAIIEVKDGLSINFLNGKKIKCKDKVDTNFSITNHDVEDVKYSVLFKNTNGTGNYTLIQSGKSSDGEVTEGNIISENIIKPNETMRYTLTIKCDDELETSLDIFEDNNNQTFKEILSKDAKDNKELDGLVKDKDIMYYHGNVDNNYVSFANNIWRILSVKKDGSVKLVLNKTLDNLVSYDYINNNPSFESTNVYETLNKFYNTELMDYYKFILSTDYCYDDSVLSSEDEIIYLPNYRLFTANLPTTVCDGSNKALKISILTLDDIMYAGGSLDADNNYFLYIDGLEKDIWTMTPSREVNNIRYYMILKKDGSLGEETFNEQLFIRPVITLRQNTYVTGTGVIEDPYVVLLDE